MHGITWFDFANNRKRMDEWVVSGEPALMPGWKEMGKDHHTNVISTNIFYSVSAYGICPIGTDRMLPDSNDAMYDGRPYR